MRSGSVAGGRTILTVVYDRVAEAPMGAVVSTPSVGVAVRLFQDVARDERSAIYLHPGDYDLVQIGVLEGVTLIPCEPQVLMNAGELVEQLRAAERAREEDQVPMFMTGDGR